MAQVRTLVLLRHAQAEEAEGRPDRERRLTRHGEAQAERIGVELCRHGLLPDAVVASPAPRAAQTARLAVEAAEAAVPVRLEERLYGASPDEVLAVATAHAAATLWVVGHNPGLEATAIRLAGLDDAWRLQKARAAVLAIGRWPLAPGWARLARLLEP